MRPPASVPETSTHNGATGEDAGTHRSPWDLVAVLAAIFVPFLVLGAYLYSARHQLSERPPWAWPMLFLSAALGLVPPGIVFGKRAWQWAPVYLPLVCVLLLVFALFFGVFLGGEPP